MTATLPWPGPGLFTEEQVAGGSTVTVAFLGRDAAPFPVTGGL